MATYAHTERITGKNSVGSLVLKYNVTPAGGSIGPGTKITVSGQISGGTKALKSVGVGLEGRNGAQVYAQNQRMYAFANKAVAKGATATFRLSFTVGVEHWESVVQRDGQVPVNLLFYLGTKAMADRQLNSADFNAMAVAGNKGYDACPPGHGALFTIPTYEPAGPSFASVDTTDEAAVSALGLLQGMATRHSKPRIAAAWAYDSRYPDQLGHLRLTLTGAMTGTYELDTASGATSAAIDLPTPTQAGTVNCMLQLRDMFGSRSGVAVRSWSFPVVEYAPPGIGALSAERFEVLPSSGGEDHEAADDGERVWLTLRASVASTGQTIGAYTTGKNAWDATLTVWRAGEDEISAVRGEGRAEDASGAVGPVASWSLFGTDGREVDLRRDEAQLANLRLDASLGWRLRITLTDALGNSATAVCDDIQAAGAVLDVGPYGVAVGKRSGGSAGGGEKFECAWPAAFTGDVAVPAGGLLKAVSVPVTAAAASGDTHVTATVPAATVQAAIGEGWTAVGIVGFSSGTYSWYVYAAYLNGGAVTLAVARRDTQATGAASLSGSVRVLCVRTGL